MAPLDAGSPGRPRVARLDLRRNHPFAVRFLAEWQKARKAGRPLAVDLPPEWRNVPEGPPLAGGIVRSVRIAGPDSILVELEEIPPGPDPPEDSTWTT